MAQLEMLCLAARPPSSHHQMLCLVAEHYSPPSAPPLALRRPHGLGTHCPPQTVDTYFEKKHNWIADGDKYVDKWRYVDGGQEKKLGFGRRRAFGAWEGEAARPRAAQR